MAGILAIAAAFGLGLVVPATSAAFQHFVGASNDGSRAFFTTDEQLVSEDTDASIDLYERSGGTTSRVSEGEVNGNGAFDVRLHNAFVDASDDGSKVFFYTHEQLVNGDTDSSLDLYERSGGTTTLVSQGEVNGNGAFDLHAPPPCVGACFPPARRTSSDGSRAFFETNEQLVSEDTDGSRDVYERSGGTTTLVSEGEVNGNGAFEASFRGASSDGSKVFFETFEQLVSGVSGDTDSTLDIYERSGGTTTQVSQGEVNGNGAPAALLAGASSDGSRVFFISGEQLVSGDTDTRTDIYERSGGSTTLVSEGEVSGSGFGFFITFNRASSDGEKVFFTTNERLTATDTDSSNDVYAHDAGGTVQVTVDNSGVNGNDAFHANFVGASSDGEKVFFHTDEQLVSGDTDSSQDVYERFAGVTIQVSMGLVNGNGAFGAFFAGASSDGERVFFQTTEQLVSDDMDSSLDIYERYSEGMTLVSQGEVNGNGAFDASSVHASTDGSTIFFTTTEQLVSGDTDSSSDIYARSEGTTKLVSAEGITPETTIESGPSGTTNDPTPTFAFSSSDAGASFECKVDSGPYAACSSPQTTSHLADGLHTFYVRAKDPVENTDPTPETRSFTVKTAAIGVSGSTLVVTAAPGAKDNLRISRPSPSTLRVTDLAAGAYTGSGVHTGTGCTRSGDYTANCDAAGVTLIQVYSRVQSDQVINSTAIRGELRGGVGDDVLIGGSNKDTLFGAPGADVMKGMSGNDNLQARDLTSDTTIDCGGGSADKADLDLLPEDPDAAVTGCETKTRH